VILIVGGGFGGAFAAMTAERALRGHDDVELTLVAPENFLLFSPLLAEAASGTIEPRHAVVPLRERLRRTRLIAGTVESIDHAQRRATVCDAAGHRRDLEYRTLVLSPGSVPVSLPVPGLDEAVGFKTLADAIWLRNRVLHQLEVADAQPAGDRRRAMLTFTFVGGGYAGVEALAEMESLVRDTLRRYPNLRLDDTRWVLVEAQDRLLPGLDRKLAVYTERVLKRRGVELHLSTRMESGAGRRVVLSDGTEYHSDTIVWTVGQRPSPFVAAAGFPLDERGRVIVDDHLRVVGVPDAYAIGDSAAVPDPEGGICPPTAQHALREGLRCGRNVAADYGAGEARPFTYRNRGLAVTLGRGQGTAQVKRFTFTGWPAWWMGRSYHLLMMPGASRKARIVTDWTLSLLFPRDIAQLGSLGQPSPL
jgi:NADH dehydrogenase